MIVVTTPFLAGNRVLESKGMVFGLVVRSRGLGGNVMAQLRSLGGGEIHEYTELLEDTRRQALDRLVQNATLMGANAILSMRFDSSELSGTMSEIVAYGTAVVVEPDAGADPAVGVSGDDDRCALLILALGALLILGGFAAIAVGGWVGLWGLWLVVGGLVIVAAILLERRRYRSVAAEVGPEPPGPGGGEPLDEPLEPRFSPTTERFVDPTTGVHDAGVGGQGVR